MNKRILFVAGLVLLIALPVLADDDDDGWKFWKRGGESGRTDVAPVNNDLYKNECGSCHMPYQPGLLPARSWQKLMTNLADHFGDNAELGAAERSQLEAYLVENAADRSGYKRSIKFANSIGPGEAPMRITETGYFLRKHDEVPLSVRKGQGQVKSMANCSSCHPRAEMGSYNEHEVKIPGLRRWDD